MMSRNVIFVKLFLFCMCVTLGLQLENRIIRMIFNPNSKQVTGSRRILHSKELHNLYSTKCYQDCQVEEGEIERACSMHKRNMYKILVRKPKKKSLGIDGNILKQGVRVWTHLVQDRDGWCILVNFVTNTRVPHKTEFVEQLSNYLLLRWDTAPH